MGIDEQVVRVYYQLMTKQNDFNKMLKEFRLHFSGPTSDLIKYLVDRNIMTKTEIASAMHISRETLYNKYLNQDITK